MRNFVLALGICFLGTLGLQAGEKGQAPKGQAPTKGQAPAPKAQAPAKGQAPAPKAQSPGKGGKVERETIRERLRSRFQRG